MAYKQGGEGSSAKRTRSHNFISCNWCRSARRKCDGVAPSRATADEPTRPCRNCTAREQECMWTNEEDNRAPISRRQFEALSHDVTAKQQTIEYQKQVIELLQQMLRDNHLPTEVEVEEGSDVEDTDSKHNGESSDVEEISAGLGKLVMENDTATYYGGPSPFRELPSREESRVGLAPVRSHSYLQGLTHQLCQTAGEVNALESQKASEWLLFLPGETNQLLSRLEHDTVLHRFFTYFSSWHLRTVPHLFLRDLARATSRSPASCSSPTITHHYSSVAHNAILSVALGYSDNPHLRSREIRDKFAKHAKIFLEAECQAPTLATVQGLAILSSYHSGFSEQGLGFMYFGMSTRLAQALGLHISVPDGSMENDDVIERNWVFWSLYSQDKCWSLYVGRDEGLRTPRSLLPLPPPDDNLDLESWSWRPNTNQGGRPSNFSVAFAETAKLMQIASSIMEVVYGAGGMPEKEIDIHHVVRIHGELRSWEGALPSCLRIPATTLSTTALPPHTFMLNLAFHWLILLLLRPFYKPHIAAPQNQHPVSRGASLRRQQRELLLNLRRAASKECPSAASHIVSLFGAYRRLYELRFSTITSVQIAYVAGKIHLETALAGGASPNVKAKRARDEFMEAVKILKEIGETWSSGRVTADMLLKLYSRAVERYPQQLAPQAEPSSSRAYGPPPFPPPGYNESQYATANINLSIGISGLGLSISSPPSLPGLPPNQYSPHADTTFEPGKSSSLTVEAPYAAASFSGATTPVSSNPSPSGSYLGLAQSIPNLHDRPLFANYTFPNLDVPHDTNAPSMSPSSPSAQWMPDGHALSDVPSLNPFSFSPSLPAGQVSDEMTQDYAFMFAPNIQYTMNANGPQPNTQPDAWQGSGPYFHTWHE